MPNNTAPEFKDAQECFENAIKSGVLSTDKRAENFAGHYMYMGTTIMSQLETIHENLVDGNRKDCVTLINDYGLYDFWEDYKRYLITIYESKSTQYMYFPDMVISYHRITNR